jgi:hypothetical protein
MRLLVSLLALSVISCAKGPAADLPSIKQARSAAAEWALVNEQALHGQLTRTYIEKMREAAREELISALPGLSDPTSSQARIVGRLLVEPPDSPPARLRAYSDQLKSIETGLESA